MCVAVLLLNGLLAVLAIKNGGFLVEVESDAEALVFEERLSCGDDLLLSSCLICNCARSTLKRAKLSRAPLSKPIKSIRSVRGFLVSLAFG